MASKLKLAAAQFRSLLRSSGHTERSLHKGSPPQVADGILPSSLLPSARVLRGYAEVLGPPSRCRQRVAGFTTTGPTPPKLGLSSLILLFPCAVTFALGTWQLHRRLWKIALLEDRQQRLMQEPLSLREAIQAVEGQSEEDQEKFEFRRARCKGVYNHKAAIFVGPRGRSSGGTTEKGYLLIEPLVPAEKGGRPLLVNRGWVPSKWRDEADGAPPPGEKEGEVVEVCGVIRGSDNPSSFVPPNSPDTGQWFFIDVPAMAAACGLDKAAPLLEATREGEDLILRWPEPRHASELARFRVMPQDHLNYAMTWYTLAVAITAMAYMRLFGKKVNRRLRPRQ